MAVICLPAACSDTKTVGGGSTVAASTTGSIATPVQVTDAATTTAAQVSTTAAATTTTAPPSVDLVLRDAGIGAFALGEGVGPVVDGISATLGAPISDATTDYPVADGHGEYTTADGDLGFVAPMGRAVCWSINLCAHFGGGSAASLSFTGWTYTNDPSAQLSSASGGTIGARWSDLPALVVDQGGCYSVGGGTIDGIRATLESSGEPFSSFDDAGNYIVNAPSPADVTITWMETGKSPISLYGDC